MQKNIHIFFLLFNLYTNQLVDSVNSEQFEDILIYFSKSLVGKENEEDILWDLAKKSKINFT